VGLEIYLGIDKLVEAFLSFKLGQLLTVRSSSGYYRLDVASRILTLYYLPVMTNVNTTQVAVKLSMCTSTSTSRCPLDSSTFLITLIAVFTFTGS